MPYDMIKTLLHAPESNLFYHLKNYQKVFIILDLILTH